MPLNTGLIVLIAICLITLLISLVYLGSQYLHRWVAQTFVAVTMDLLLTVKESSKDDQYLKVWEIVQVEIQHMGQETQWMYLDEFLESLKKRLTTKAHLRNYERGDDQKRYRHAVAYVDHWCYLLHKDFNTNPQGLHIAISLKQIQKIAQRKI